MSTTPSFSFPTVASMTSTRAIAFYILYVLISMSGLKEYVNKMSGGMGMVSLVVVAVAFLFVLITLFNALSLTPSFYEEKKNM